MNLETIEREYVTFAQIASEAGVDNTMVHNWDKYHRYFQSETIFGRRVVKLDEYARFKAAHPELFKQAVPT